VPHPIKPEQPAQQLLFETEYGRTKPTPAPPPPSNASATSRAAALSMVEYSPTQRDRVLSAIIAAGPKGATNEELADALNMRVASVSARRNELLKLGYIVLRGERPGSSGRSQHICIATPQGKEAQC
jgi:CRP-like cAMP-binding protein